MFYSFCVLGTVDINRVIPEETREAYAVKRSAKDGSI